MEQSGSMLPMNSSSSVRTLAAVAALVLGVSAPVLAHFPIPPKKTDRGREASQTPAPDFALTDQDGRPFRFVKARGKVVVTTFVFTTCPDVCPLLSAKFAGIQRALREKKMDDYLLLSITTDPERDTPAALKAYAERYQADFGHWLFLTGSTGDLEKVWKGFGVTVKKTADGQVQHTALTTLVDRRGIRRIDYYTDKWTEKEILRDIASLDAPKRR
jgi:protein SCO1